MDKNKKQLQLQLNFVEKRTLLTALNLYIGKFSHAYGGAIYFSAEARSVIETLDRRSKRAS